MAEEKKRIRYVVKLKEVLNKNTVQIGNLSVLQTILKRRKDKESRLVLCGQEDTKVQPIILSNYESNFVTN